MATGVKTTGKALIVDQNNEGLPVKGNPHCREHPTAVTSRSYFIAFDVG